jgi:hypothetical protein
MLWTDDFLFLHIPKTAGKSLTKAFVQSLGRPMTCIVSKGQQMHLLGNNKVQFKQEKDEYAKLIENLKKQFDALMQSNRWKVGHAIISLMTLSMFKKNFTMSTDHIKKIFQQYDQLKSTESQLSNSDDLDYTGLTIIDGRGHENIIAARNILDEYNNKLLESFKAIIVAIRNPYDLMVSNYFFMRDTYFNNRDKANFQIAEQNSFEDYAVKVNIAPVESWMTIDRQQPKNLRIIRFENLQEDFDKLANEFRFKSIKLPHINKSSHGHYTEYLSETAEAAIYEKFKYLFEMGFYSRHRF